MNKSPGLLFRDIENRDRAEEFSSWQLELLPDLQAWGVKEIDLDYETDGLEWYNGHKPIGFGIGLPLGEGKWLRQYHPFRHRYGRQHAPEVVERWHREQLRHLHINNLNTGFEVHMAYSGLGVDLDEQGCTFSDVAHYAALLDDHRTEFTLESLVRDELKDEEESKVLAVNGHKIEAGRMADYPPGLVAVRAIGDVRQVRRLKELYWPRMTAEDLHEVRQLEEELIPVVCEMERNGCRLDMELLERWLKETEQEVLRIQFQIAREVGFAMNLSKSSNSSWTRFFEKLKIPITHFTKTGRPSFTDENIEDMLGGIEHPTVKLALRGANLVSLRSKYLLPYKERVGNDANGLLRYKLYQLKTGEGGTVSGRFSSADVNIQQVMAPESHIERFGDENYMIRRLFIPDPGSLYWAADAEQIEYRIFASYANNPKILEAYRENPRMKFHKKVQAMLQEHIEIGYKQTKNTNFMQIYGGGLVKLAMMTGYLTKDEAAQLKSQFPEGKVPRDHPKLAGAVKIKGIYDRELSEVPALLEMCRQLAMPSHDKNCLDRMTGRYRCKYPHRGFVKTVTGRRARFLDHWKIHAAFNRVVQGGAGDVNKRKLIELYRRRKELTLKMRATVHDEVFGDVADKAHGRWCNRILNRQSFPQFKVMILWDGKTGENWERCKPDESTEKKAQTPEGRAELIRLGVIRA